MIKTLHSPSGVFALFFVCNIFLKVHELVADNQVRYFNSGYYREE